ncbi:MAG TPA: enoyl-CoA hydratase/isomerase family protein [Dehalococcoidia bacterium]|nr:enoyl-CoA hydratase/isomerase family protein [Dehalococcoidia bacterium]
MTDFTQLILEYHGPTAVVRLNRVEKHNAISRVMAEELVRCLEALDANPDVRVIVLTGAGDKAFCAGADMAEAALGQVPEGEKSPSGEWRRDWAAQAAVRLLRASKPVIAAVNGYAYGGGAVFAINCDIRICSENARFRFVGASYGLAVGASVLPRIVGGAVAKELIFTARTIDADEAQRIGLANHVVPLTDLERTVLEMAEQIAANSPSAVAASKEVIDIATSTKDAAKAEFKHNVELRQSEEHLKRFRAAAQRVVKPDE